MNISGNTVLITGGTRGIGLALTKQLADMNNRVVIVGRNVQKLETISRENYNISSICCDLSRQEELDKLLVTIQQKFTEVNILINNAGQQYNYYLTEESLPYQRIDEEIQVNFTSVVKLSTMLLPVLNTKKEAAIVNVSSGLAFAPKENAAVYCATKAAIHNFSTVLRYQLEKTSIKVFELIPPLVETEMTAGRGSGKMLPKDVATVFCKALSSNIFEINVGKIKVMRKLLRWFPGFILKKLRYSV